MELRTALPEFIFHDCESADGPLAVCTNLACARRFRVRPAEVCERVPIYYCSEQCVVRHATVPVTLIMFEEEPLDLCVWVGFTMHDLADNTDARVYLFGSPLPPEWTLGEVVTRFRLESEHITLRVQPKKLVHTFKELLKIRISARARE